jgi:hypothetical protein
MYAKHALAYEVTSHRSGKAVISAVVCMYGITDKVFSIWSAPRIMTVGSYLRLHNENLFVARGIRELELENWVVFWRVGSPR